MSLADSGSSRESIKKRLKIAEEKNEFREQNLSQFSKTRFLLFFLRLFYRALEIFEIEKI